MPPPNNTKAAPGRERLSNKVTRRGTNNANHTVQGGSLNFERNRVPSAFASLFPPDGAGRKQWWVAYRCPHCEASHLGRSRERIQDGLRRSRCGRRIWLVISRTYRARREMNV